MQHIRPLDERVEEFSRGLAILSQTCELIPRGQIPGTTLILYDARAPKESVDGVLHDARNYRCIDLRNMYEE